jgi:hypothetical protein
VGATGAHWAPVVFFAPEIGATIRAMKPLSLQARSHNFDAASANLDRVPFAAG